MQFGVRIDLFSTLRIWRSRYEPFPPPLPPSPAALSPCPSDVCPGVRILPLAPSLPHCRCGATPDPAFVRLMPQKALRWGTSASIRPNVAPLHSPIMSKKHSEASTLPPSPVWPPFAPFSTPRL